MRKNKNNLVLLSPPYVVIGLLVFMLIVLNNLGHPDDIRAVSTKETLKSVEAATSEIFKFDTHGLPEFDLSLLSAAVNASVLVNQDKQRIDLTIDPTLQKEAKKLLRKYNLPWATIVAIEPKTGRVLSLASYSEKDPYSEHLAVKAGFPAASLFKIITAAAALEKKGLLPSRQIKYRGGNYILNKYNYLPDTRRDKRKMSFEKALSKSCNPVFARIALNHLSHDLLTHYASEFGFNQQMPFDAKLEQSEFELEDTSYSLARTAAGFGKANISPLHAASLMAAIANDGLMMKPHFIEKVQRTSGELLYQSRPSILKRTVLSSTADKLLEMMQGTVVYGTAKKQFRKSRSLRKRKIKVAAKTGTISGKSPKGRYHWFIAAAPAENPEIAIASLVIDPGNARLGGTAIGRLFLEKYFSKKGSSS